MRDSSDTCCMLCAGARSLKPARPACSQPALASVRGASAQVHNGWHWGLNQGDDIEGTLYTTGTHDHDDARAIWQCSWTRNKRHGYSPRHTINCILQSGHEIVTRYMCGISIVTLKFEHLCPCRMLIQCCHVLGGTDGSSGGR